MHPSPVHPVTLSSNQPWHTQLSVSCGSLQQQETKPTQDKTPPQPETPQSPQREKQQKRETTHQHEFWRCKTHSHPMKYQPKEKQHQATSRQTTAQITTQCILHLLVLVGGQQCHCWKHIQKKMTQQWLRAWPRKTNKLSKCSRFCRCQCWQQHQMKQMTKRRSTTSPRRSLYVPTVWYRLVVLFPFSVLCSRAHMPCKPPLGFLYRQGTPASLQTHPKKLLYLYRTHAGPITNN